MMNWGFLILKKSINKIKVKGLLKESKHLQTVFSRL